MAARISRKRIVACLRLNGQKQSAFSTRLFEMVTMDNTAIRARCAFEPFVWEHSHEGGACRTCEELVGHLSCSDMKMLYKELLAQAKSSSFRFT
eukprot:1201778-Pleurochrysis_carterae.AAC.1